MPSIQRHGYISQGHVLWSNQVGENISLSGFSQGPVWVFLEGGTTGYKCLSLEKDQSPTTTLALGCSYEETFWITGISTSFYPPVLWLRCPQRGPSKLSSPVPGQVQADSSLSREYHVEKPAILLSSERWSLLYAEEDLCLLFTYFPGCMSRL